MKLYILFTLILSTSMFAQNVELLHEELNKFQNLRDFCSSQNGEEVFFTIQSPGQEISQIVCVKNGGWNDPTLLSFCDEYSYLEAFLSYDGKRLYFASDRPKSDSSLGKSDFDIWYVERNDEKSEWSEPINLGEPVNSENDEFYPTLSENNNLYFTMDAKEGLGKDDIYQSAWNGTAYSPPILLSTSINSEGYEFNAFISRDETFLIYTKYNAEGGFGSGDLYIAKRDEQGEWIPAKNMGSAINSKYMEYCPFYDGNTNTLYFTSRRNNRSPKKFQNLEEMQQYISTGENGLSKIYKCKIEI